MLQLRSFIQQRLSAAAEEILGEVERTITLALSEAQLHPPKEELHNEKLDSLQQTPGILMSRGAHTFPLRGPYVKMNGGLWAKSKHLEYCIVRMLTGLSIQHHPFS